MPHLSDLIRRYTALRTADVEWLHALLSDWQLLADLSFADLVLWVRLSDDDGWVAVAQMRPTTGPTAFQDDLVELVLHEEGHREPGSLRAQLADKRLLIDRAWSEGRIIREGDPNWSGGVPVREELIPVRRDGQPIAVLQRSTNLSSARTPSRLELTYLQSASDLAQMISEGEFPFDDQGPLMVRSPRVGDGLLRLDRDGRVEYASPNALSAYRRLGLTADLVGAELAPTSLELAAPGEARDESLSWVAGGRAAGEAEIGARGVVVQLRAIPLIVGGTRSGALIMVRDVTELRRRERELLTKDATIREIHHRVKNNLQTVAALLRLQSRRLDNAEGRLALNEAVRRVGAIALVHETLAHAPDEIVDFDDIADRVMEMAAEVSATERPVRPVRIGQFGSLPTMVATPLSMALTELVQNSVEHGLRNGPGRIEVEVRRTTRDAADGSDERLLVTVTDDGVGFPEGLDVENTQHLGLQIVRTLVVSELGGKFAVGRPGAEGSAVTIDVPVEGHPLPAPRA
ncbi:histidine kinase N-terminal domain-containing protein [Spiractinospora alimapuensis]|uniref:PAS domain-containing sensor histidine kinase n=1 Tax=Spiractinospora alimapuensis TaxID=2820884 RepID=UPI001F212219|nr:PAS domain-containing sensor histidine kinase [Spiractinospora alimapuensis]QVQ54110.1 histidine kinase N-terminal domain-containing protein [Spiractinospora alimapuensis]